MGILSFSQRRILVLIVLLVIVVVLFRPFAPTHIVSPIAIIRPSTSLAAAPKNQVPFRENDGGFHWSNVPQKYPVSSFIPLPTTAPKRIPEIQHKFGRERRPEREVREARLETIRDHFEHAWQGYRTRAWLQDEVAPLSGGYNNIFGGWAASMIDALDTLWIMKFYAEFEEAIGAVAQIDFSTCAVEELNVFETTIRYLGGFLSAYDVSEGAYEILLRKAIELGDMLYVAFDTPNRMPVLHWDFHAAKNGARQEAKTQVLVAELGSLTLEFTRLSQLTGDPKYYDAIQRIMNHFDTNQNQTKLSGMWPVVVNAKETRFDEVESFTIGGMADSLYEYLPKQYLLLGGGNTRYRKMYEEAIRPIKRHIFYRPMTSGIPSYDVLLAGEVMSDGQTPLAKLSTNPSAQHLACFAGGMVGLAAKLFKNAEELSIARKLVDGCLWAYEAMPHGIMPEVFQTVACSSKMSCRFDQEVWHGAVSWRIPGDEDAKTKIAKNHLPRGVISIEDRRYLLRPEAIESVFVMYRITGDKVLRERAWNMFENIVRLTKTDIAHASLEDCTADVPVRLDRMESFWFAETLKYFYLIMSEPSVISLDDYVFNTEAHPLKLAF